MRRYHNSEAESVQACHYLLFNFKLENREQNFEDFLQVAIDSSFKVGITGRETSANGSDPFAEVSLPFPPSPKQVSVNTILTVGGSVWPQNQPLELTPYFSSQYSLFRGAHISVADQRKLPCCRLQRCAIDRPNVSSISTLFFKVTFIFRLNIFQHEKRNFVYENDYVVFFLLCLILIIHNVVFGDFPNSEEDQKMF